MHFAGTTITRPLKVVQSLWFSQSHNVTNVAIIIYTHRHRRHGCLSLATHEVEVKKQKQHKDSTQESQDWPKYPKQKRECRIEKPIPHYVQKSGLLQELSQELRSDHAHGGHVIAWRWRRASEEEAQLGEEGDGERVEEEGEKEYGEESEVFESHHVFAVCAVH